MNPIAHLPARPLHKLGFFVFAFLAAVSARAQGMPEPLFSPFSVVVPSRSLGGVSPYGRTKPDVGLNDSGDIAVVHLPGGDESDTFVWWYANHVRSRLSGWPEGKTARARVTLRSSADAEIDLTASLEAGGTWIDGATTRGVRLTAGNDATLYLPLPEKAESVAKIRIVFSAKQALPALDITGLSVGSITDLVLSLPDDAVWRTANPVTVTGRAKGAAGRSVTIRALGEDKAPVARWTAQLDASGSFSFQVDRRALPECRRLTLIPSAAGAPAPVGDYSIFAYPVLDADQPLHRVTRAGRNLVLDGKPYAFLGVNYTPFDLGLSRKADFKLVARNFREMKEWGVGVIRLNLAMALIQPAPHVFPDQAQYATILKGAGLDPNFFKLLKYAVSLGRHYGIRIIFDWHESMVDRHRYFLGGNPADAKTDKPGTPLAWLAPAVGQYPEEDRPLFIQMDKPRDRAALFDTTSWLVRAFKGEGTILGYEVPYNEPHERAISNDRSWRWLTAQTALRVKQADPDALTFGMPSGWGHENIFISSTWLLPDLLDGMTPHFYVGNGPIPLRPDAGKRKAPYLAREVEPSLSTGLISLALPYSAAGYPVYNGEGGGFGSESFLPDMARQAATRIMIESQIVQAYASGMCGYLEWTMWNNSFWKDTTLPNKSLFQRYAPVFAAGPVDNGRAKVLFVQNPVAAPTSNGHNYSCVPFGKIALDLHLLPVSYMTDSQLIYAGQTLFSRGFEQVDTLASGMAGYKAMIIDTRNLDQRALAIARRSGIPLLEFGQDKPIDEDACAEFLKKNGVPFDRKTAAELEVIHGPGHLVVYRRRAGTASRVYPLIDDVQGRFELVGEDGAVVFTGTAGELASEGFPVEVAVWTGAIFTLRQ